MEGIPQQPSVENVAERTYKLKHALFGAFLAALPAEAEAVDFPPGTDWLEGVAQFYTTIQTEEKEYAGLYLEAEEVGNWTNPVEGKKDSVTIDSNNDIIEMLRMVIEKKTDRLKVCVAHTHPHDDNHEYLVTPSVQDMVSHVHYQRSVLNEFSDLDTHVEIIDVMFNQYGVWYFSVDGAKVDDVLLDIDNATGDLHKYAHRFNDGFLSGDAKDFKNAQRVYKLGYALKGIHTRFVSYEDVQYEPPCAGPKYKAPR